MIDGQGVVLISYSERFRVQLAQPVAQGLSTQGLRAVLIGDEPLPARVKSTPETKVNAYFAEAQMVVYLMTPDDRTQDGEVRTRQNIIDELRIGMEREHLKDKLMVFKADKVALPSNVNPVYDRLPLDDSQWVVDKIVRQAREWGLLAKEPTIGAPAPPAKSSDEETLPLRAPGSSDAGSLHQAQIALAQVRRGLDGEDPDLNALERAQLLISSLAAERRNADTIGVILANRMFTERHALRLLDSERTQLVRTWLRHTTDQNAPGLAWVKDLSKSEIVSMFTALALGDSDDEVRAQALRILGMIRAPVRVAAARALVQTFLSSERSALRRAGIDYVRLRGAQGLRRLLDEERLLTQERSAAREAGALLDLGRRPSAVLARFIDDADSRSQRVRDALIGVSVGLPRSGIAATFRSEAREVVSLGLELSARRADMPLEPLIALIGSERSRPLRLRALEVLIQRGVQIDDELLARAADRHEDDVTDFDLDLVADVKRQVFLQRDPGELWNSVSWTALDGPYRYEAAVQQQPSLARQARTDLRNSFDRLVIQAREEIVDLAAARALAASEQPPTNAQRDAIMRVVHQNWASWSPDEKLGRFMLDEYREAALRALAEVGRLADVQFVRKLEQDPSRGVARAALMLLRRFGTPHDTERVIALLGRLWDGDLATAELALRLAYKKDKLNVLDRLRRERGLSEWAVAQLADVPHGVAVAWDLMRDENRGIRVAAADVLWHGVAPELRDRLLTHYMSDWHYFNVVRWFDERLYAPDWLGSALRRGRE